MTATGTVGLSFSRSLVRRIGRFAASAAVCFHAIAASAAQLDGKVIGLSDGDTITVLDITRNQHKVRLAGIDAPEKKQPFGNRSRQHLADLVFQKQVLVEWSKRDRYGRIVGKVLVAGQDVSLKQITAGLAWHYKAYQHEQTSEDRALYADSEDAARAKRIGLWQDSAPVAPWNFRSSRRKNNR